MRVKKRPKTAELLARRRPKVPKVPILSAFAPRKPNFRDFHLFFPNSLFTFSSFNFLYMFFLTWARIPKLSLFVRSLFLQSPNFIDTFPLLLFSSNFPLFIHIYLLYISTLHIYILYYIYTYSTLHIYLYPYPTTLFTLIPPYFSANPPPPPNNNSNRSKYSPTCLFE